MFHIMVEDIKATIFFPPEILHEMRHDHRAAAPGSAPGRPPLCKHRPGPRGAPALRRRLPPRRGPHPPGRMRHLAAACAGPTLGRRGLRARMRPGPPAAGRLALGPAWARCAAVESSLGNGGEPAGPGGVTGEAALATLPGAEPKSEGGERGPWPPALTPHGTRFPGLRERAKVRAMLG